MSDEKYKYDIFISYAREDVNWVREHVYLPLLKCVNSEKRLPRVFLDTSELGLKPGEDFTSALAQAVQESKTFIPIYSKYYFKKPMAQTEMTWAFNADPMGQKGKLNPILKDPEAATEIPYKWQHLHYIDTDISPDWFNLLIRNLGLTYSAAIQRTMKFSTDVSPNSGISINNTLSPVVIELTNRLDKDFYEEWIEISASNAELQGTLKKKTENGVATFADLSFKTASSRVCLIARAYGYQTASSDFIEVVNPAAEPDEPIEVSAGHEPALQINIPNITDIVFFESGNALAVMTQKAVRLFNIKGNELGEEPLTGTIRHKISVGQLLVLTQWDGRVLVFSDTGQHQTCSLRQSNEPYAIPGGCMITGAQIYAGLWNGKVYQLSLEKVPEIVLAHSTGIQHIQKAADCYYILDIEGNFYIYQTGHIKPIYSDSVERYTVGMQLFSSGIVIVGEEKVYKFVFGKQLISEKLPMKHVRHILPAGDLIMLVDEEGQGCWLDENLIITRKFHTTANARPLSCDHKKERAVFLYPDGSRTLLHEGHIVYTHYSGVFNIAPGGSPVAVGDQQKVILYSPSDLEALYVKEN